MSTNFIVHLNLIAHLVETTILVIVLVQLWHRERLVREFHDLLNELSSQVEHLRSRNEEWLLDQ